MSMSEEGRSFTTCTLLAKANEAYHTICIDHYEEESLSAQYMNPQDADLETGVHAEHSVFKILTPFHPLRPFVSPSKSPLELLELLESLGPAAEAPLEQVPNTAVVYQHIFIKGRLEHSLHSDVLVELVLCPSSAAAADPVTQTSASFTTLEPKDTRTTSQATKQRVTVVRRGCRR
jgi:hypothetical protein